MYEDWRDVLIGICNKFPDRICPFCEEVYMDDAEYVDVGVGGVGVQVTPNHCDNSVCGAYQLGAWDLPSDHDYKYGWARARFSCPDDWKFAGHEWWCAAAGKFGWRRNLEDPICTDNKLCPCHTDEEKAKAEASGILTRENFDKMVGRIGTVYLDTGEPIKREDPFEDFDVLPWEDIP